MTTRYHHTQVGALTLAAMLIAAASCAAVGYLSPPHPGRGLLWALAAGFVVLAGIFSSLTIEVTEDEARWHFGPGLWRYRIARHDIDSVAVVRNSVWNGFGIRMRPGFRLYNVSGLDAVELRLKNGEVRRIGTDDAAELAAALKSQDFRTT
jgi:hypothetical protein